MRRVAPFAASLRNWVALRGRFFSNLSWITSETLFQALATLVVGIAIARLVGPDAFGFWTYALAIYSVAVVISTFGTEQIVVLDLVKAGTRSQSVLATAFALRLGVSILAAAAMIGLSWTRPAHEADLATVLAILALAVPLTSIDVTRLWFRAHMRFQAPAVANIATTFFGSAAKIVLVVATGSIVYAGLAHVVQVIALQIVLFVLLVAAYNKIALSDIDCGYAKSLLRACLPILLADIAIVAYMRANIFLLDTLRGAGEVGIYGAATRISEAVYLLPMVIVTAASPAMYRLFNGDRALFLRRFDQLLTSTTAATVIICIGVAVFADRIVLLLFGTRFEGSSPVLVLHVWTALFAAQGVISSVWLLAEKATMLVLARTFVGAVINIALGLLLIPHFGARGAAVATLVAMAFSSMIALLFAGTMGREILGHQLRSLVLMPLWSRKVSK